MANKFTDTKYLTKAALIAAMYVVLVVIQMVPAAALTYGPVQLRLAEGLTVLPFLEAAAVPGLFIGCLISNIILVFQSGFGIIDVVCGSLVTLLAAYFTKKSKNRIMAFFPPILLNGFIVSIWVSYFTNIPYWTTVLTLMGGEAISVVIFGSVINYVYEHSKFYKRF